METDSVVTKFWPGFQAYIHFQSLHGQPDVDWYFAIRYTVLWPLFYKDEMLPWAWDKKKYLSLQKDSNRHDLHVARLRAISYIYISMQMTTIENIKWHTQFQAKKFSWYTMICEQECCKPSIIVIFLWHFCLRGEKCNEVYIPMWSTNPRDKVRLQHRELRAQHSFSVLWEFIQNRVMVE